MIYLPTILILTLAASLIVAFIFNPVFAVSFMRPEGKEYEKPKSAVFKNKWFLLFLIVGILLAFRRPAWTCQFLIADVDPDGVQCLCIEWSYSCFSAKSIAGVDEPL